MRNPKLAEGFGTKPRCCEWCEKRGWKDRQLTRVVVENTEYQKPFKWWVHTSCRDELAALPQVVRITDLGGY